VFAERLTLKNAFMLLLSTGNEHIIMESTCCFHENLLPFYHPNHPAACEQLCTDKVIAFQPCHAVGSLHKLASSSRVANN
jgi:hypothetical protein